MTNIYKTVKMITLREWNKLVETTYGRGYDFQQQDGCKSRGIQKITVPVEYPEDYENDTVPEIVNGDEMGVSFAAWLARDPNKELPIKDGKLFLDLWWSRNFYPHVDMVANDLYARGLIEAGDYIINIDW